MPAVPQPGAQQRKTRSLVYFTMFASFGTQQPFVPLLYSSLVPASQVGILSAASLAIDETAILLTLSLSHY